MQGVLGVRRALSRAAPDGSRFACTGPYPHLTARSPESRSRSSRTGSRPSVRRRPGRVLRASRPPPPSERSPVYDEDTHDRPRRRPVLLAMLVAAALLLALAGSGAVAGNGGTAASRDKGA